MVNTMLFYFFQEGESSRGETSFLKNGVSPLERNISLEKSHIAL